MSDEIGNSNNIEEDTIMEAEKVIMQDEINTLSYYFLKYGRGRFGISWLTKLNSCAKASPIIPRSVMASITTLDLWKLLREPYIPPDTDLDRSEIQGASFRGLVDLPPLLSSLSLMMQHRSQNISNEQILHRFCTPLSSHIATMLNLFESNMLRRNPSYIPLIQLGVMVAIAIQNQRYLMSEFKIVLQDPKKTKGRFLPTMPESRYFSSANGPNVRNQGEEKSLAGYILGEHSLRWTDSPHRISKHGVAVVRFILHSCMALAVCEHPDNFSFFTRADDQNQSKFVSYLLKQMIKCVNDVACALQRNQDDAHILLYRVLERIINTTELSLFDENCGNLSWSTMHSRRMWEKRFHEIFVLPIFGNIDEILENSWNSMNEIGLPERFRRDLPLQVSGRSNGRTLTDPILCRTLEYPDIGRVLRQVRDCPQSCKCDILQDILCRRNLQLLRFLIPV